MTEDVKSQEQRQADLAPELHNDEQNDHRSQAQEVAEQARNKDGEDSPFDSEKVNTGIGDNSGQDIVDRMRDMEQSGRIDMSAYEGEDNLDDNEDKYGENNKVDPDLPSDGSWSVADGSVVKDPETGDEEKRAQRHRVGQ